MKDKLGLRTMITTDGKGRAANLASSARWSRPDILCEWSPSFPAAHRLRLVHEPLGFQHWTHKQISHSQGARKVKDLRLVPVHVAVALRTQPMDVASRLSMTEIKRAPPNGRRSRPGLRNGP